MKRPCAECPFKKTSAPGWLGPYRGDPRKFIADTWQEEGMRCHMEVAKKGNDAEHCAGGIICANKSAKTYRRLFMQSLQAVYRGSNYPNIMNVWEFIKHHTLEKSE